MNPWLLVGIVVGVFAVGLFLAFVFVKIPDARRTFDRIMSEESTERTEIADE